MPRNKHQRLIDISIPLHEGMMTYPGNPEVTMEWVRTPNTFLTKLTTGTHAGTHVDAPRHVREDLTPVDEVELERFFGPCRVLDMTSCKEAVRVKDLESHEVQEGERILLKTSNSERGFKQFYDDYVYLDGDAADYLAEKKVALVGIDSLSIKKRGGDDQRPHESLLLIGIPIIEGLNLKDVEPGQYTFIGLPLRLKGRDGSPMRAVLIDAQR